MTPERYQQIKAAFRLALGHPLAEAATILQQAHPADPDLVDHVLNLLAADTQPFATLDRPAVGTEFRLRTFTYAYTALRH